ncbi:MAG: DUF6876 family protein [Chitinophagaceae bacterium]
MTNANVHFGSGNGTKNIYSCRPFPIAYTDGVRDMVENCKVYRLIDLIISHQTSKKVNCQPFQVWKLERFKHDAFIVRATDGNNSLIARRFIPFTDFSFDTATIWLGDDTLLRPCEY